MADDRWDRIEALFDEALDLDAANIPAWLERVDEDIRPDLERLLRAHRAAGDFLESPAAAAAADLVSESGGSELAGTSIGPYRITREIGRGGMGAVYLAHRDDVDLDVAIKRLPHSAVSSRTVRAFLAERRTLARLDHANIARLLDAGLAADGVPYFVMEWVDGESLTRFCDSRRLGIEERLRLFLEVCDAVEYAHGRLVVHRDLKPSNVFVTREGVPKLLDFGIAKVLDEGGPRVSTQTLGQFMTPQYASPEQIRGEAIGTASDVYSLGTVLYELLAGRPPHDADTGTPFEVSRAALENEPTPLPEAVPPEAEREIAEKRSTSPRRLRQRLAGDLATIVAQAMHKDRNRRYGSVAALADDLRHYRDGRPVRARGDSFGYRADRFVRRNWLPLALAATVLVAAGGFAMYHTRGIATERDRSDREAQTARAVSDFLISVFLASDPDQFDGKEPTAQDLLARGTERLRTELDDAPAVRARLLAAIGSVHRKRGRFDEAKPLLEESLALRRELYGESDPEVIQSLDFMASLKADLDDFAGAVDLAQEAIDLSGKIHGPQDPETVFRLHNLGSLLSQSGRLEQAEPILRRSLAERRRILGEEHAGVAHAVSALAHLVRDRGRYREAADLYAQALDLSRRVYGNDHMRVASVWNNLARMHARLAEYDEAERCIGEALRIRTLVYGEDNVRLVPTILARASVRVDRAEYASAEVDYLRALALLEAAYGPEHERVSSCLAALADAREGLRDLGAAESTLVRALEIAEKSVGVEHAEWARIASLYASFLSRLDRPEEALSWAGHALSVQLDLLGAEHERTRATRVAIAEAYRQLGRLEDARRSLEEAAWNPSEAKPDTVYERANWAIVAGRVEKATDHDHAARAYFREAVDLLMGILPRQHPRIRAVEDELAATGGS